MRCLLAFFLLTIVIPACQKQSEHGGDRSGSDTLILTRKSDTTYNVIFILSDDHRYDFMGFTGKVPWLETPSLDMIAREGCHIRNAFATTALCSPSRASILTGLYSHTHKVVDNQAPIPEGLVYFPQYLQKAGYQTAFFGKWHMGDADDMPQPGFDHWESFRGQGEYYNPELNIDGQRKKYGDSTYITDLLTGHALDWLNNRDKNKPFFLYLSHKAVHAMFQPAQRHKGKYQNEKILYPPSYNLTASDEYKKRRIPEWVKQQRYSWHGVDYMYHGQFSFESFFKAYCETLKGIDESAGRLIQFLTESGLLENTVVFYMGDNGFSFGEHGLIDKRHAYEESWRVPLLVYGSGLISPGSTTDRLIQNVDIAPTILELAGLQPPTYMQGKSFLPILRGANPAGWRDKIFYEYYWEYDYPQTPTMHAVRSERYKFIRYNGIWDTNEFYDLQNDPWEMNNLIASPEHQEMIREYVGDLWTWLETTGGMQVPLKRIMHAKGDHRDKGSY